MRSVCKENDSLWNLPRLTNERGQNSLMSRDRRRKRNQKCSCKPKHNLAYTKTSPESSYFATTSTPKWKFMFKTESMSHHPGCHLFVRSCSITVTKVCMKRCGAFLSGAIEASISITRGAGGFSISPDLRCARAVPANNPAFKLLEHLRHVLFTSPAMNIGEVKLSLETGIQDLARLFRDGKASPYDVDLSGNTLLHVCLTLFTISSH